MSKLISNSKSESDLEIERIAKQRGLSVGIVKGVIGDLARMPETKESQAKLCSRWGIKFGDATACRNMGKVTISELRGVFESKAAMLHNSCQDILAEKMNNPEIVEKLSLRDASTIAKQQADIAAVMSNTSVGGGGTNVQINIGDVKALIGMRHHEGDRKSAVERLKERGVKAERLEGVMDAEIVIENENDTNPEDEQ